MNMALTAALALLAACGNGGDKHLHRTVSSYRVSDQPAPPAEQVLRRSINMSPRTIDPSLATGNPATNVILDLFEGLGSLGPDGKLVPGVASSWDISDDGLTYTFNLRPNARWSNGQPLTASDFVYSWRRVVDPKTGALYAQSLNFIVNAQAIIDGKKPPSSLGVSAVGPRTLRVQLVRRTPYFIAMLYNNYLKPLYKPAIEKWGDAWTRPGHIVGNGAFMLTQWVINGHLTLKKNPYYWDAAHVRLREVIDYPIASRSASLSRFLADDLDFSGDPAFPASDVDWLRRKLGKQVRVTPRYASAFFEMLVHKKPFDNRKLRLALTMVLDRKVLDDKLMHGLTLPAYSLFPPLPGYTQHPPAWASWPMPKRIAVARRLYREAGYSTQHPLKVKLLYMTEGAQTHNYMEAVVTMWHQALGADVTLLNEEWKVMLQDIQYKNAKLFWHAWNGDYPAPYTFAQQFVKGFAINYGGYDNPDYQLAVKRALAEPDKAKRYALYGKASDILNRDAPFIPLYFYKSIELVKPYVAGVEPDSMALHRSRYIWIRMHMKNSP